MAGVPPLKNSAFTLYTTVVSVADTTIMQANPTIAAGDFRVSIDGGALNNPATLPVVSPAASKQIEIALSAAEMNGDVITVIGSDQAGAEWCDVFIQIFTDTEQMGALVDAVWDEALTPGTHDVGYSAGQRLRYLILTGSLAQAGTPNSITLANTESAVDNIFNENIVSIVSGLGAGQTRLIAEYTGATRVAIVDRNWDIAPNGTSVYEILPFVGILLTAHGLALGPGVGNNQIELAASSIAIDDIYVGSTIVLTTGTGPGQARLIADYDGGTQIATVTPDWTTNPDATTVYKIIPVGRTFVDDVGAEALDDISATVWGYATRTLTASAAAVIAAVLGSSINITRGDSLSASLTGLGNISTRSKLWFTVKRDPETPDTAAIIQIEETAGLVYLNGAAGTAIQGSITVTDAVAGDITIALDEVASAQLAAQACYYDVQMLTAGGTVTTLTDGGAAITSDITRATS